MTAIGFIEKLEEIKGYAEAALKWLPGDEPHVAKLRELVAKVDEFLDLSGMRVAMAEAEAKYSADAQVIADNWPSEPTAR